MKLENSEARRKEMLANSTLHMDWNMLSKMHECIHTYCNNDEYPDNIPALDQHWPNAGCPNSANAG